MEICFIPSIIRNIVIVQIQHSQSLGHSKITHENNINRQQPDEVLGIINNTYVPTGQISRYIFYARSLNFA